MAWWYTLYITVFYIFNRFIIKKLIWFWHFNGIFSVLVVLTAFTGNMRKIEEKRWKTTIWKLDNFQASEVLHHMKGFPSIYLVQNWRQVDEDVTFHFQMFEEMPTVRSQIMPFYWRLVNLTMKQSNKRNQGLIDRTTHGSIDLLFHKSLLETQPSWIDRSPPDRSIHAPTKIKKFHKKSS